MPRRSHKMTWEQVLALEPRLGDLLLEAQSTSDASPHFCANRVWYGYGGFPGIKPRLVYLVGTCANNPALRSSAAYDVAYDTIYEALPNCKDCGCM